MIRVFICAAIGVAVLSILIILLMKLGKKQSSENIGMQISQIDPYQEDRYVPYYPSNYPAQYKTPYAANQYDNHPDQYNNPYPQSFDDNNQYGNQYQEQHNSPHQPDFPSSGYGSPPADDYGLSLLLPEENFSSSGQTREPKQNSIMDFYQQRLTEIAKTSLPNTYEREEKKENPYVYEENFDYFDYEEDTFV